MSPSARHRAKKRIRQLGRVINPNAKWSDSESSDAEALDHDLDDNVTSIRIGDVTMAIVPPKHPELVPDYPGVFYQACQETLQHLKWMLQKDKLKQDMFLIGSPGPLRRHLVMTYAAMTQREIEYVSLSKDVTDADLKQRRELRNGTSYYVDQAVIRAALHGRILVLDGIEKAERNVLPILNNLLENREMSLSDGRFLTNRKVNTLDDKHKHIEFVDDRFLVIALGVPVPPYIGYPLDPPLRSRFQSRDIRPLSHQHQVEHLLGLTDNNVPQELIDRLVSIGQVLREIARQDQSNQPDLPEFPISIDSIASLLELIPNAHPRFLIDLIYPFTYLPSCDSDSRRAIEAMYKRFGIKATTNSPDLDNQQAFSGYTLGSIDTLGSKGEQRADATFVHTLGKPLHLQVACGEHPSGPAPFFVETPYHVDILSSMIIIHAGGRDICLIGTGKGVGKSVIVRQFAKQLGYDVCYIPLYRDMSSRDFLQRRSTTPTGDTIWENSLLVDAAIHGHLAILDGIETLSVGALTVLQRLTIDREIQLPDGTQLVSKARFESLVNNGVSMDDLEKKRIFQIHPSFRIIALATGNDPSTGKAHTWLTGEVLSMFQFVVVDVLPSKEEQNILACLSPSVDDTRLNQLLTFAHHLRRDKDDTVRALSNTLSTRQLIRICRRIASFPNESLYLAINRAALSRFMPSMAREALHQLLVAHNIIPPQENNLKEEILIECLPSKENAMQIKIGNTIEPVRQGSDPMLIPNIVFYENPAHNELLEQMLMDFQLGEHLLLIGNQGVGKNKLADYFLQLLRLPREYIQLHRDSSVQSLTVTPAIRDGVLISEDSPLIKAVREGYILVVDEADKAPTHVTAILKSLVEDGEMVLGDGRRIVSRLPKKNTEKEGRYIPVHQDFRMIVLANRPGYPFLGNDFYKEIGHVFSCHAVDNPDKTSELSLLRKYGPSIDESLLEKLSNAFTDLRRLSDDGLLSYPYSTRELVNVAVHLQSYPNEGISKILQNVFDFDQYDQVSKSLLLEIFDKHGIPVGLEHEFSMKLGNMVSVEPPVLTERWNRISNGQPSSVCSTTTDIAIRGGWEVDLGKKWKPLERRENRSIVFSEQLYSFNLPTRGEALDVITLDDGTLFAVTTNPVMLHCVNPQRQMVDSLDLYEYFPLQQAPPKLRLSAVQTKRGTTYVVLHNPTNNELLCCDIVKKHITSAVIRDLEPVTSIMCSQFASNGLLVFYQQGHSNIAIFDFNHNKQHTLILPHRLQQLYIVEKCFWLATSVDQSGLYALYDLKAASFPNLMEAVHIEPLPGHTSAELESIDDVEFAPHARFAQGKIPIIIRGCSLSAFIRGQGCIEVWSYLSLNQGTPPISPVKSNSLCLRKTGQLATIDPSEESQFQGNLSLLNPIKEQLWSISVPLSSTESSELDHLSEYVPYLQIQRPVAALCEQPDGTLVTLDRLGLVRVWQVYIPDLYRAAETWKQMIGVDQKTLAVIYETDEERQSTPETEMNQDMDVQNQDEKGSAGGSGGAQGDGGSGSGSGGIGGSGSGGSPNGDENEGRQEASLEDINRMTLRTNSDVPPPITEAEKDAHDQLLADKLKKMSMTNVEYNQFQTLMREIRREVWELRVILEGVEAKRKERIWLKNQTSGDIDDTKMVEGLTGEKAIYRKRGDDDPEMGLLQDKPKRMDFVFDLSASMYRFNSHDRRLERSMQVALMLMEAFRGFEHKFSYRILGHSGDSARMEFVGPGQYPKSEKEVFDVLHKMRNHAQYCLSGDNTLGAVSQAVKNITQEDADDYFVVVLSDANIGQYNIQPTDIARALTTDERVTAQMIFIGSLQFQAQQLRDALGTHAHICNENKDLPKIMKSLFLMSMVKV